MTKIVETVVAVLLELLGQAIKGLPSLLSALVVLFLTKYAVKVVLKIADEAGKRTLNSRSLRLLLLKVCRIGVWLTGRQPS